MKKLLTEVCVKNIADFEIELIFNEVSKIEYNNIPERALFLLKN